MTSDLRQLWSLDPTVDFLNHGSFGACPLAVQDYQRELREQLETQPVNFMLRVYPKLLAEAREQVAEFIHVEPQDLVFVRNATTGVNAVLRSLRFAPGDEILTTNHTYGACKNTLAFISQRWGAKVVVAEVPFPIDSKDSVIAPILDRVTAKTKLALLDHVTSPTGLVFPLSLLVEALKARGVETLVDGAHAVGMLDLNLTQLGAAYYTSNFHKWLCAPKGAAFLWVRPDCQPGVYPLTISHGYTSPESERFTRSFDWTGTDDPTSILSVKRCLEFFSDLLPNGWNDVRTRNHELAVKAQEILSQRLAIPRPAPRSMLGALAAVPLPAHSKDAAATYQALLHERFEVVVHHFPNPPSQVLRVSAQLYNSVEQYERLASVLTPLLAD